jgi:signal transduction histidine kinase
VQYELDWEAIDMRIRAALLAAARGLALALLSQLGSVVLLVLAIDAIAFMSLGVGLFLTPAVMVAVRGHANLRRRLAREWYGVEIAEPYRPRPEFAPGFPGVLQRWQWIVTDPATWRDMLWMAVDATAGCFLALLAFALIGYFPYGLVLALGAWRPIYRADGGEWFTFMHVTSQHTAWYAAALGAVYLLIGVAASPTIMRGHALLTRAFLAPTREQMLALRVARLAETRSDALDVQAAELRRIERDLHDGAQARLVAMGLSLSAIEHLLDRDPEKAKQLLAEARQSSSKALGELRDLVRGIHPPVLAERGLGDAVRALALASPLKAEVNVELPGRLPAPVDSAAYFAVSEVLTNAAKHSGAQRVWVDLRHADGTLRISVTDDGQGGADASRGTGLRGIERRLGTFDGVLALSSPLGGPTMVTMELPCALSSPRTSSC